MIHKFVEDPCECIDSAVFNGDLFFGEGGAEHRAYLRKMMARWERRLVECEEMDAEEKDEEAAELAKEGVHRAIPVDKRDQMAFRLCSYNDIMSFFGMSSKDIADHIFRSSKNFIDTKFVDGGIILSVVDDDDSETKEELNYPIKVEALAKALIYLDEVKI